MTLFLWLVFMFLATLSIISLARLSIFNVSKKYKYFKYLNVFLFVWTLIIGLRYVATSPLVIYYASLAVYPLVYLITGSIFLAIFRYQGKDVSKHIIRFMISFLFIDLVMAFTNDFHSLMRQITYSTNITNEAISLASHGLFFYVHTAVCYVLLFIAMLAISVKLYSNLKKDRDVFPFVVIILSIILGITANVINLFFIDFVIDPTYIALVVLTTLLYQVFYIRDLKLIFKLNGNEFILDNLREMYLLVNQRDIIVSASSELINKFSINIDEEISFNDFKKRIADRAIIFTESMKTENEYDQNMLYLHMMEKEINLPLLKHSAKFYLFYDETQNQKYINEINYVMTHDLMTKIYNRNYFENLEAEIEANYENYSLVIFDLDGLKLFNDYLGHEAGDLLLIGFANALKEICEKYSNLIPIRMGGDEFLLIAPNKDMNDIEEILYDLKILTTDKDLLKHIGFSYGYAQNNYAKKPFKKVMTEADANQYAMKMSRKDAKVKLEKFLKQLE